MEGVQVDHRHTQQHKKCSTRLNPCEDETDPWFGGDGIKLRLISDMDQKISQSHSVTSLCNQAFVSLEIEELLDDNWAILNDRIVLRLEACSLVPRDGVVLDANQRLSLGGIKSPELVHLRRWSQPLIDIKCSQIWVSITSPRKYVTLSRTSRFPENMAKVEQIIHTKFLGHVMTEGQNILLDTSRDDRNLSKMFDLTITEIIGGKSVKGNLARGLIENNTVIRAFPGDETAEWLTQTSPINKWRHGFDLSLLEHELNRLGIDGFALPLKTVLEGVSGSGSLPLPHSSDLRIPEGFHDCTYARKIVFVAYDPKYEETECARNIELPEQVFHGNSLEEMVKHDLMHQVIHKGQKIYYEHRGHRVIALVKDIQTTESAAPSALLGGIHPDTTCSVVKVLRSEVFRPGINPDDIAAELTKKGIVGMDCLFTELANSLFKHKFLPVQMRRALKIQPIRGVLFYGPPGTGKTLIARNFCKMVLCATPKIVNGPEIMDSYHGNSEKNVRDLFLGAKSDYSIYGSASPLHVIIFDEIDSIARKRGQNVNDQMADRVVNQLSTMLDGVASTPNLLVLATTNRKGLIDPAILRPGRIEKHVYVGFPKQEETGKI